MSKPRVLQVVGQMTGGGIQRFVLALLREAVFRGIRMDILEMAAKPGPLAEEARDAGANVYTIPLTANISSFRCGMAGVLARSKYTAVHVQRSSSVMGAPLWVARQARVPVRIAHYQNIRHDSSLLRRLLVPVLRRLVLQTSTHILGVSSAVLDSHFVRDDRADPRMKVVPNGIETERYAATDRGMARAALGYTSGDFVVGHLGRFSDAKNHRTIIEVAARMTGEVANARFLLVGDGPEHHAVEAEARRRGIADRIRFVGWVNDPAAMLGAMDAFLFPSLWEGFPLALLEAQAAGLPIVASDIACHREALPAAQQALLAAPTNAAALSGFLIRLYKEPQLREGLASANRQNVRQYHIRAIAAQLFDIYEPAGEPGTP